MGDSVITETSSGFIGVSNIKPTAKLSVSASTGSELRFDAGAAAITPVLSVISQPTNATQGGASVLAAGAGGAGFVFSDNLPFGIVKDTKANVVSNNLGNGTILAVVTPNGYLGIGTTNPQSPLDVNGNINITTRVAGVVTAQTGVILGEGGPNRVLVATTGRVKVRVDANRYPIHIGDLLVTSGTPGMAMKSQPFRVHGKIMHRPGTIIGKALESLSSGEGTILVLVSLQ